MEKRVQYIPRLARDERAELIVAYIRGQMKIDEFRLRVKKSRTQAFRIIRAFKQSDAYIELCDDEWDRMTFSKEFDDSIPALERYHMLTKLKVERERAIQVNRSVEGGQVSISIVHEARPSQ